MIFNTILTLIAISIIFNLIIIFFSVLSLKTMKKFDKIPEASLFYSFFFSKLFCIQVQIIAKLDNIIIYSIYFILILIFVC
jgi:hypothetical protein